MLVAVAGPAFGQAAPAPAGPGFRPPTAEEINRQPPPPPPGRARASVNSARAFAPGPCPAELANATETLPLTGVDFTPSGGGTLHPRIAAVLAPVAASQALGAQPLRVVCDLRDRANAALQSAGFVAAVLVPAQTLVGGRLQLQVVTGKIKDVRVRGDAVYSRSRIQAILEKLTGLVPLNEHDVEAILIEANSVPGTIARVELSPADQPGLLNADVAIDQVRGSAYGSVNNLGSREIGRYGLQARGELYGLTGLADRTYLSVYTTGDFKEQQVVQLGHDFAPGLGALRLGGQFSYAWTHPTLPNAGGLELRSRSYLGTLDASYPLLQRVSQTVIAEAGLDIIDQRTRASGQLINIDKLRVLFARIDSDFAQRTTLGLAPVWRIGASLAVRKGTGLLSATRTGEISGSAVPTRFEGDPQAFVLRGEVSTDLRARLHPGSPFAATLALTARGQYSDHPLLSYEELAVGNLTIGRGYDPGANSADRAYGGTVEVRAGKPVPASSTDWAYEGFGFYDAVRIFNLDTGATENRRTLASAGGGVRVTYGGRARLDLTYAKPLDKAFSFDARKPPARLLLTLTVKAWP